MFSFVGCADMCCRKDRTWDVYKKGEASFRNEIDWVKIIELLRYVRFLKKMNGVDDAFKDFRISYLETAVIKEDQMEAAAFNGKDADVEMVGFRRKSTISNMSAGARKKRAREADQMMSYSMKPLNGNDGERRKSRSKHDKESRRKSRSKSYVEGQGSGSKDNEAYANEQSFSEPEDSREYLAGRQIN